MEMLAVIASLGCDFGCAYSNATMLQTIWSFLQHRSSEMLCCAKQGHLHTYRFCDNVWTFILENASFKTDNEVLAVDRVKIVACDAKILAR